MSVDVRQVGACSVVRIEDRFDTSYASWLGHSLTTFARDEPGASIIIDLSEVAPIEPGATAALWAALADAGVPVAIVSRRMSARRIMRRWGGKRMLVFPTVAMAVDALTFASGPGAPSGDRGGFRHEAFLYDDADSFVDGAASFIREGVEAGEQVLVAVSREKIELLRDRLGGDEAQVRYADMAELGRNPARIIPAWQAFVRAHLGEDTPVRGVGEPIWSGRSATDLVECQHHESLLNLAFADSHPWWLLCPYDVAALPPAVIDEAHRSHPTTMHDGAHRRSEAFLEDRWVTAPFDGPLPPVPEADVEELEVTPSSVREVAAFVARVADAAGHWPAQVRDLAKAASEIAANSVEHGGGRGWLRVWRNGVDVVCEVRDGGHISDPLVGRRHPEHHPGQGRGLWLANQLCDLVQIRSSASLGTVVRLHARGR